MDTTNKTSTLTDNELLNLYSKKSGKDYELNKMKDLNSQQHQLLDSNLATQQSGLAKSQTNAQQSASINNDKLMKYIGQSQLANGVATGQTSTDFINANNAYSQNRATINNNYSAQNAALLQQYAGDKLQANKDAFNSELNILDKYYGREYQEGRDAIGDSRYNKEWNLTLDQWAAERDDIEYAKKDTQNQENYTHAENLLEMYLNDSMADGYLSESEASEIDKYLEKYTNPESEGYIDLGGKQKQLQELLDLYKGKNNGAVPFTSNASIADAMNGRTKIIINGTSYDNISIANTASTDITRAVTNIEPQTMFIYGDKVYAKTKSGVYEMAGSHENLKKLYADLEKAGYKLG